VSPTHQVVRAVLPDTASNDPQHEIYAVAVYPAVSVSCDDALRLWDLESGQCLHTLESYYFNFVSMTPDGQRAVSDSEDKPLRVWDLESGQCLHTLKGHGGRRVSVTPDGRRAVSGSHDKTVRLWDLQNGECLAVFVCDAPVECLALAQDGRTVVVGTSAGEVLFLEIHGLS